MNIEEIKNKLDIFDVVNRYVKLKRVGRYYSGICPFHKDKKPSFYISSEMQIFKCFGCGLGGDVIKFLMQIENLTYAQVLEKIKNEYGLKIENLGDKKSQDLKEEKEILEINYAALKFFRQQLKKNKEALTYLISRGLTEKTIDFFELGFSPGNTLLRDYLYSQGYNYDLIKKAGLIDSQNFDRFQSRIIFPLRNEKGKLVGFTGRIFPDNFPGPKYLNTPETLIFKKSQFLYGLYFAKEYILANKKVILVEGQFDFLLAWQNNIKNIVAVSGSALTDDHLRKLKKYSINLVLAFDNDEAGFRASLKANLMAKKLGFQTYKLIYQGKDLGELNNFQDLKEEKFEDYLLNYLLNNYQDKKEILSIFLPQIKNLSAIEIDNYLDQLSIRLNIDKFLLQKELKNLPEDFKLEILSQEKIKYLNKEETLEEKLSLRVISLIYALNDVPEENFAIYLAEKFKQLFLRVLEKKLDEEEFNYLEMLKNFYLTTNLNLKKELQKTIKNLKILFLKKNIRSLNEKLKLADEIESVKILNKIKTVVQELKKISKNA